MSSAVVARSRFREHPLDGAMLYFHPETGTHVRARSNATRALRRRAPRVVMFGITNHCNLRCAFCSRDAARTSDWTAETAASVLEGLAEAGTLEVAFGGGEPFAFRGFEALLVRLHTSTALALNVTTNGTLLRDDALELLRGVLGQVRLSVYDGQPWRAAAERLGRAGHVWGANVLVDDDLLPRLEVLLADLAALGARDVSLLSYVGPDVGRHLSADGEGRLGAIVGASPLPCRVSVCFGGRLPVPRLFDGMGAGGDCGAGLDFLAVTPDRRVQSCSFQEASFAVESAEDVLTVWRTRRAALAAASPRAGCARRGQRSPELAFDGLQVWQGFSGNNSGECILVAKFDQVQDADRVLAELVPSYAPGQAYSAPWKELFVRERVDGPHLAQGIAPDEMVAVGRSLIARTASAPGDDFPELRALAWKRGAEVVPGGVHVHEETTALVAVRVPERRDMEAVAERARGLAATVVVHGDCLLAALSTQEPASPELARGREAPLAWMKEAARTIARDHPVAMELFCDAVDVGQLTEATKRLGERTASRQRLAVSFWGHDLAEAAQRAERFAAEAHGDATRAQTLVLVERLTRRKRLAVLAHRRGAGVASLDGDAVLVSATFWREASKPTRGKKAPAAQPIEPAVLEVALADRLRRGLGPRRFEIESCEAGSWGGRVAVRLRTNAPAVVLTEVDGHARAEGLSCWVGVSDLGALERAVRRLLADVVVLGRRGR